MSQIGADTAQMRATIAALRQGRENVQDAVQRAAQAMQALQGSRWSGQHRVQIEERWEQIQTQFTPTLEVLDRLATRTERLADAFEDAGHTFGGQAGNTTVTHSEHDLSDGGSVTPPIQPPITESHLPLLAGKTRQAVLNATAGCTTYVLSKVNLDAMNHWPDAQGWNEAAIAAGFPVGKEPSVGSAMVFEPGVMGAHATSGHVAYVEQVTRQGDLIHVTISEANVARNQNGVLMGTYTPPTTRQIDFKMSPDGHLTDPAGKAIDGVSFIYGKAN